MLGIGHGETRVKRHRRVLIELFRIQRHGVPSYSTIRRILMGVDFDQLAASFNQWAKNYVELDSSEWCGIDGKSIKGTVCDYKSEYQNESECGFRICRKKRSSFRYGQVRQ